MAEIPRGRYIGKPLTAFRRQRESFTSNARLAVAGSTAETWPKLSLMMDRCHTRHRINRNEDRRALLLFLIASMTRAEPIASGAIQVIDGDTISTRGQTVRLVGFDTPEAGMNAQCEAERGLAAKATGKLRQLVAGGGLDLSLVRCSCPAGTEGTQACNYGRACGVLKAAGKDVGAVLIADGLAKPFHCSRDRCPRRQPWC